MYFGQIWDMEDMKRCLSTFLNHKSVHWHTYTMRWWPRTSKWVYVSPHSCPSCLGGKILCGDHVYAHSHVWLYLHLYTWGSCLCMFICVGTPVFMCVVVRGQPQLFSPMSCRLVFWGKISEAHPFSHVSCQQVPGTPRLLLLPGITSTHPHSWPVQEELHYWATP